MKVLVAAKDPANPADETYNKRDIVLVINDAIAWGGGHHLPDFVRIEVPNEPVESYLHLKTSWVRRPAVTRIADGPNFSIVDIQAELTQVNSNKGRLDRALLDPYFLKREASIQGEIATGVFRTIVPKAEMDSGEFEFSLQAHVAKILNRARYSISLQLFNAALNSQDGLLISSSQTFFEELEDIISKT